MAGPTIAVRAVAQSLRLSPYPPSVGGFGTFAFSLGSLLTICGLAIGLFVWVSGDIIREWKRRRWCELVTLFRLVIFAACAATIMATLPRAIYMLAWNDEAASVEWLAWLLRTERMVDAVRIVPATVWMGTTFLIYPFVVASLTSRPASGVVIDQVYVRSHWRQLLRPVAVAIVAALLAYTVAIIKGHEPVPGVARQTAPLSK